MNDKQYYRAYLQLQQKQQRTSIKIVQKGLKSQFEFASSEYLINPNVPIELLVKESDTLNFLSEIYFKVGIKFAKLVDKSLSKYKSSTIYYQTKAQKPKEYLPANNPNNINIWKDEFTRFAQSKETAKKVVGVTRTTREQIRKVMAFAVEHKLSHKQTAKLILQEADGITTKQRALTIARTEGMVGSNQGALFAAKTSGLVLYKKWIARSGDPRTRDQHKTMIGSQPIPMDSLFNVDGENMLCPGDGANGAGAGNIVNCRCIVSFIPASEIIQQGISRPKPITPIIEKPKPIQQILDFSKPMPLDLDDILKFKPATSIEEATKYAIDKGYGNTIDYSFTKDVKVANEFNRVLFELKRDFNFDTLATIGNNTKKGALMSANFKTLNIKHSYWKSEKIIFNNFAKNVDDFKGRILRNIEITKSNYEKTKRFAWKMQQATLENQLKYTRWTVKYSKEKYLESTIFHEYGHVLHDQLIGGINGEMALNNIRRSTAGYIQMARELNSEHIKLYELAQENGDVFKISAYGASNNKEFFSETFVMYRNNDPDLPIYIKEFFDKLFRMTKI